MASKLDHPGWKAVGNPSSISCPCQYFGGRDGRRLWQGGIRTYDFRCRIRLCLGKSSDWRKDHQKMSLVLEIVLAGQRESRSPAGCLGHSAGLFLGTGRGTDRSGELIGEPSGGRVTWRNLLFSLYSHIVTRLTTLLTLPVWVFHTKQSWH